MRIQAHGEQAFDVILFQNVLDRAQNIGFPFQVVGVEPGRQFGQGRFGRPQTFLTPALGQLFVSAQLAVGHVKEVRRAMNATQSVPGFDMGGLVVAVAWINVVMDRHRPVLGDAQAVDQPL